MTGEWVVKYAELYKWSNNTLVKPWLEPHNAGEALA